jgi:hypothetical protein
MLYKIPNPAFKKENLFNIMSSIKQKGGKMLFIKYFPPSWFQIKNRDKIIYIDPAYLKIDVALLPIGGTFTMDIQEAVEVAIAIKPKVVIPMHNFKADPQEFKDKVEARSDIKVVPLKIGEDYHLK